MNLLRIFKKDTEGLHYAVRIFLGTSIAWLLLRKFGDVNPVWAVISVIVVTEPHMQTAWVAFQSRIINTLIGSAVGLLFLIVAGPGSWTLPLALTATVLVCTYIVRLSWSWRIAPITAALVIASSVVNQSKMTGVEVGLRRVSEVMLGSAIALLVTFVMARLWRSDSESEPVSGE